MSASRRWCALTAVFVLAILLAMATLASAASPNDRVPLRLAAGTALAVRDQAQGPAFSAAIRPASGTALAAWDFAASSRSVSFAEAELLDRFGRPLAPAFAVDPSPPPIAGYHVTGGGSPVVAYSPSSDAWVVVVEGDYGSDQSCTRVLRGHRLVFPCRALFRVLSVPIDATGHPGSPATVLQATRATIGSAALDSVYGPYSLACRAGDCMLLGHECLNTTVYECNLYKQVREFALPLSSEGALVTHAPTVIDRGGHRHCPNDYPGLVLPPVGRASIAASRAIVKCCGFGNEG